MKKLLIAVLLVVGLSTNVSAGNFFDVGKWMVKVQGDSLRVTTKDDMFGFEVKGLYRTTLSPLNFSYNKQDDISKWTFTINKTKKIGYFFDETKTISTFYKIEHVVFQHINGAYMITGRLKAQSSGKYYFFILNDFTKTLTLSGPELPFNIVREYDL